MFVSRDDHFDPARVRLGDEGQGWQMMPLSRFLSHPLTVPYLVTRLADYLAETGGTRLPPPRA